MNKSYQLFRGKDDPCPPLNDKFYSTPPHLYAGFQEEGLEQYSLSEALKKGTLWPIYYEHYDNPYKNGRLQ